MLKNRRRFLACLLAAALDAAVALARDVPLVILQTTDLHGHILSAQSGAGLLRSASVIRGVRSRERNVLYVDCGDLVQGSPESWLSHGEAMLKAIGSLGCDAWVLGNHDFDWGFPALRKLLDLSQTPVLAANLSWAGEGNPLVRVHPFVIREIDGLHVALVGLTSPAVPGWLRPELLEDLRFQRSAETLSRVMPSVRAAQPDILVLLVHQGYQDPGDDEANEVHRIADAFPEFDVILGGHLHSPLASATINGVLYSQSGSEGRWVGRVDLVYDTVARKLTHKAAELIPITTETPEDAELAALLKPELDAARTYGDETIGTAETALTASGGRSGSSGVQQLIARAIAEETHADVVLHGVLSGADLPAGPVTMRDVWGIVPYENRIGVVSMTFAQLKDVLEENAEQAGNVHFLGSCGIRYELARSAPRGRRVVNLTLADGTKPHPKKLLRVATNSYALASGGGRFPLLRQLAGRPEARLEMTDIDTRKAVINYIRNHSPLKGLGEEPEVDRSTETR